MTHLLPSDAFRVTKKAACYLLEASLSNFSHLGLKSGTGVPAWILNHFQAAWRREYFFFSIWEFGLGRCGFWKGPSLSPLNRTRESFVGRALRQTQILSTRERPFPRETLGVSLYISVICGFFFFFCQSYWNRVHSISWIFLQCQDTQSWRHLSGPWYLQFTAAFFSWLIWLWAEMVSEPSAVASLIAWLFFCSLSHRFPSLPFLISAWLWLHSLAFTCPFKGEQRVLIWRLSS